MPKRDARSFARFEGYLDETGLLPTVRAILAQHHISLEELYRDDYGFGPKVARLEIWWWMTTRLDKSISEIARIFDREWKTVWRRLRDLNAHTPRDQEEARAAARALAVEARARSRKNVSGERLPVIAGLVVLDEVG